MENEFQKYGFPTLSPEGHNYQLSYSAAAAKNSVGQIYYRGGKNWFLFRLEDKSEFDTTDIQFEPPYKNVFAFYLGHKLYATEVSSYISRMLQKRSLLLNNSKDLAQTVSLVESGLSQYSKKIIMNYNNFYYNRYSRPTGITVVFVIRDPSQENPVLKVIYPNNKIIENVDSFYEGKILEEEYLQFIKTMTGWDLSQSKVITPELIKSKESELKKYSVYHLNFDLNKIQKIF